MQACLSGRLPYDMHTILSGRVAIVGMGAQGQAGQAHYHKGQAFKFSKQITVHSN